MNILLLGAGGQLGFDLEHELTAIGSVFKPPHRELDITHEESLKVFVQRLAPDVIVNAAAYTAVDKAEHKIELANLTNSTAVSHLAKISKQVDCWLIHFSTDYVFDGSKTRPYVENDHAKPLNAYGRSKLLGENAIISSGCKHLIFRVSWLIGRNGSNFVRSILRAAKKEKNLNVVSDQAGVLTSTPFVAKVCKDSVCRIMKNDPWPSGLYNVVPNGTTNWYEIAVRLLSLAEEAGLPLNVTASSIKPIKAADYITDAKRPKNSILDNSKVAELLSFEMPSWEEGFNQVAREIINQERNL